MIPRLERSVNYVILGVFAALVLVPLVNVVVEALGLASAGNRTGGIHLENFPEAWREARFSTYMANSVLVTVTVLVIAVVVSTLAGFALGTMTFRGSGVLFYLFLLGIMVPAEAIVIPLFFDLRALGLTDTLWGVALPQVAQSTAFGTYWMRTYFRASNRSIAEAARIDGAGSLRALWSIHLPIARPALVTLVVLLFMWTWNEFLIPLVMSPTGTMRTVPLGLAFFQGQHTVDHTLMAAAAVMVALPVIGVYLCAQRHFIRGMLEGAVRE
ncbi:MAG: carbohydrate ABC transporter permease [Bifidobacteriaceae bacterium]|jgi:raffinose/stachyose/melibiose transport system permease protein|nr:carbohydrate ABC transporter permease [Bifidobacteriaceae bacterium]